METRHGKHYALILAGGSGRRLWPVSRERKPKQFIDFFGSGRTMLQQTYDRLSETIPPERILVSTDKVWEGIVAEQLPAIPARNILGEPVKRNTAPSTAWAAHRLEAEDPGAVLLVLPSDQAILDPEAFRKDVEEAMAHAAAEETVVALGVQPTRPEPGYGYIQTGEEKAEGLWRVKSFTEKPDRQFAQVFIDSGDFIWNTGIFAGRASVLLGCLSAQLPPLLSGLRAGGMTYEEEESIVDRNFRAYPNTSLDYVLLEKSDNVAVKKCKFGWADLGTWHSMHEALRTDERDNVTLSSDTMMDNCTGCIVSVPEGRLAVLSGLDGYIVAEEGNVLLVCKKGDSSDFVRKAMNIARIKRGPEYA